MLSLAQLFGYEQMSLFKLSFAQLFGYEQMSLFKLSFARKLASPKFGYTRHSPNKFVLCPRLHEFSGFRLQVSVVSG